MNKIIKDKMDTKIKDDLTNKIIGCAMKVHNTLGNGFQACLPKGSTACRQEVIYQLWLNKFGGKATISKTLILIIIKSSQS